MGKINVAMIHVKRDNYLILDFNINPFVVLIQVFSQLITGGSVMGGSSGTAFHKPMLKTFHPFSDMDHRAIKSCFIIIYHEN